MLILKYYSNAKCGICSLISIGNDQRPVDLSPMVMSNAEGIFMAAGQAIKRISANKANG